MKSGTSIVNAKLQISARIPGVGGVADGKVVKVPPVEASSVGLVGIVLPVEGTSVGPVEDASVEDPVEVGIEVGLPMEELGDSMIEEKNFSFHVFILWKIMARHSTPKMAVERALVLGEGSLNNSSKKHQIQIKESKTLP